MPDLRSGSALVAHDHLDDRQHVANGDRAGPRTDARSVPAGPSYGAARFTFGSGFALTVWFVVAGWPSDDGRRSGGTRTGAANLDDGSLAAGEFIDLPDFELPDFELPDFDNADRFDGPAADRRRCADGRRAAGAAGDSRPRRCDDGSGGSAPFADHRADATGADADAANRAAG